MGNKMKEDSIPVDEISISGWNVRTSDREKGVEELAENIREYGLLQPVMVFQEGGKYNLIIGQRRVRAFMILKKEAPTKFSRIPARIYPKKPSEEEAKILSLSENIHKVELNREDIVKAITYLYNKCDKSVKKVSRILGKPPGYIYGYLKIDIAPPEVKEMYYRKEISKQDVKRIMELVPKNSEDMITLAKDFAELTPPEKKRAVELKRLKPQSKASEIIKEAKRPHIEEKVIVPLSPPLLMALDNAAKAIGLSREEIARKALEDWLSDKGYYK